MEHPCVLNILGSSLVHDCEHQDFYATYTKYSMKW